MRISVLLLLPFLLNFSVEVEFRKAFKGIGKAGIDLL
jgi:hypothetical protein